MARFQKIPEMEPASETGDEAQSMRCAGCGSKIGSGVLERVLRDLDEHYDPAREVEDAAVIDLPDNSKLVQTVDYFRSFVGDLYSFGQIAALHALGDLFAMGIKAHSAQVMATVPFASEDKQYEDLLQLMSGVKQTLDAHDVQLLGGHSSEAEHAACGLSVNGFAREGDQLLSKAGMRSGEQLVLLKPLGSGVLFAADMRAQARGDWVDSALQTLLQSCWPAVAILRQYKVSACTDITGFGLAGHLYEMLRGAGLSAEIRLQDIPAMDGVLQLIERGIQSTLAPQNQQVAQIIESSEPLSSDAHYQLLFDPQTAGGLLASIPADGSEACLEALREAGFTDAAIIGRAIPSDPSGSRIRLR